MAKYDCTEDVLEHKRKVSYWLGEFSNQLLRRSEIHDDSKLKEPEKELFDTWTPELKLREFGSTEYKDALIQMGEGLKHHYEHNRHHPEHHENGIYDMTLMDLVEMIADWMAAAQAKNELIDLEYLSDRFKIGSQLRNIILNTLREEDFWNEVTGVPITYFAPEGSK